jgi:hypothetical protein
VEDAADEFANDGFAIRPIDRYRDSAHCVFPSEGLIGRKPRPAVEPFRPRNGPQRSQFHRNG